MSLVKKIFDFFCFFPKKEKSFFIPKDKFLILRPDGTWVIKDSKTKQQNTTSYYNMPPMPMYNFDSHDEGVLLGPPDEFPQKLELREKLDKCLELGVISSCCHKSIQHGVYLLDIQLPYDSTNANNWNQYKMFVKAMEEKYNFETVREEKIFSKISSEKYYAVSFRFDPRTYFLKKRK